MHNFKDDFEYAWEERFEPQYGFLRKEVENTLDAYLECGILDFGAARISCPDCKSSALAAFSCKMRGVCPSCAAKRAVLFAESLSEEILASVAYRHVVWSIPKMLRPYFLFERRNCSLIFKAAWDTVKEMYGVLAPDSKPGAVMVLQTSGEALNFNPHLHTIITDGMFLEDGSFQTLPYFSAEKFTEVFCLKLLALMKRRGLIEQERVNLILSFPHSGFSVWGGEPILADDTERFLFLARYSERAPLSLEKLSLDLEEGQVHYTLSSGRTLGFDPLEFLALLSCHIPHKWESVVRYYGVHSSRYRGEQKKRELREESVEILPQEAPGRASRTWAALIKKIYNVDPLLCSRCGGTMKIVAFVTEHKELIALLKSAGIKPFKAAARIQRAPPAQEDFFL